MARVSFHNSPFWQIWRQAQEPKVKLSWKRREQLKSQEYGDYEPPSRRAAAQSRCCIAELFVGAAH